MKQIELLYVGFPFREVSSSQGVLVVGSTVYKLSLLCILNLFSPMAIYLHKDTKFSQSSPQKFQFAEPPEHHSLKANSTNVRPASGESDWLFCNETLSPLPMKPKPRNHQASLDVFRVVVDSNLHLGEGATNSLGVSFCFPVLFCDSLPRKLID